MRLGIFGGTFDPVHFGHLLLAEQCREQWSLDAVWLLPAAVPPHKQRLGITAAEHRLAMLELATAGHPALRACDLELQRGGTSYTVETLASLRQADADRELFLLLGADSLADLPTWREPRRILELATVVAVNRGRAAVDPAPILAALTSPAGAHAAAGDLAVDDDRTAADRTAADRAAVDRAADRPRIVTATMPAVDLSATDLRLRAAAGRSLRYMTPRAVEEYIREHRLYAPR